jgi:hypothetical protein
MIDLSRKPLPNRPIQRRTWNAMPVSRFGEMCWSSGDSRLQFMYRGDVFKRTEDAMLCVILLFAALEACTPSPQDAAMRNPSPVSRSNAQGSVAARGEDGGLVVPDAIGQGAEQGGQAAQGPRPQPVSAAENPAPAPLADSLAEAQGRRTLSTAFVRVGPDGHLTVELRNGRVLVLRNTVMHRREYCGMQVLGGPAGVKYCGGYADIAAARPGGAPVAMGPDLAVHNPAEAYGGPAKRD